MGITERLLASDKINIQYTEERDHTVERDAIVGQRK